MKIKSIKNKAKKLGYKMTGNRIFNKNKVMKLMHNHNSDDVFTINVARKTDIDDTLTDYFAGYDYYTIRSAFEALA